MHVSQNEPFAITVTAAEKEHDRVWYRTVETVIWVGWHSLNIVKNGICHYKDATSTNAKPYTTTTTTTNTTCTTTTTTTTAAAAAATSVAIICTCCYCYSVITACVAHVAEYTDYITTVYRFGNSGNTISVITSGAYAKYITV